MDNARNIEISGITCVVRSRTWMIQMKDSRFITFDNVKVIGGSDANANQDGMDWLGGGDTVVRDVFIRAADDVFAMQGNWDGYSHEAMIAPGHDVTNITVENSVLSTSISNIVRAAWPEKIFNSANFTLRNSDVIHMGIGACGIPFALLDFWATTRYRTHLRLPLRESPPRRLVLALADRAAQPLRPRHQLQKHLGHRNTIAGPVNFARRRRRHHLRPRPPCR